MYHDMKKKPFFRHFLLTPHLPDAFLPDACRKPYLCAFRPFKRKILHFRLSFSGHTLQKKVQPPIIPRKISLFLLKASPDHRLWLLRISASAC